MPVADAAAGAPLALGGGRTVGGGSTTAEPASTRKSNPSLASAEWITQSLRSSSKALASRLAVESLDSLWVLDLGVLGSPRW